MLSLVVLGESPVAGVGAATQEEALTGRLAEALSVRTGHTIHWRAIGRNGATAKTARDLFEEQAGGLKADLCIIALGVNDTIRFHSKGRWSRDLRRLIEAVRVRLGPVPVVLAGVPPLASFPALPQPLRMVLGLRARLLDQEMGKLAEGLDSVRHVPAVQIAAADVDRAFCPDRFHPSVEGYRHWGDHLAEAIVLDQDLFPHRS